MRRATGAVGPPSEQLGGEATSDGLSIAHGEPHLQQLVDDGGLVGGVDAVAVAQAQDGHLHDEDEATPGSAPDSMLEADLCYRKATSEPLCTSHATAR